MINSSPIDTWEGAGAFYTFAGSFGTHLWFWIAVACCIIPLIVILKAESEAEREHG